jgi:predicted ATP-grasp superfamily ATP-dependent carboligase
VRDPAELYVRHDEPGQQAAVLLHAMTGSIDAGHAGRLVVDHLTSTLPVERVATFDVDELLDYRSRRPTMTFRETAWVEYDAPELVVDLLRDDEGVPVLLLHGSEPDLHWDAFVAAVRQLIDHFGVTTTVGVHGIPMGVPHTRPITVTAHATRTDLIADEPTFVGSVEVPGSAAALLELRLGQEGRDALGFAANVPHYLTQTEFPPAAAELVRRIAGATGLSLPVGDLEASGAAVTAEIDRQIAGSEEVSAVVHALESQFDSFARDAARQGRTPLPARTEELPSADELGAEVEAFLAGQGQGPSSPEPRAADDDGDGGHRAPPGDSDPDV